MMTADRKLPSPGLVHVLAALTVGLIWSAPVLAQRVVFEPLMQTKSVTALLEHDGLVIGGLEGGGLVLWSASDPTLYERLNAGADLSGNNVTDLAWSGRNVWVATMGAGLTRISDIAGQRSFRQYASNLGSLDVTAVTGSLVGQSERVYYGMNGSGVGAITDGLSGAVYTVEQDGLVSNTINALVLYQGDLFVATPAGVSRFANNLFTTVNSGIGGLQINDLTVAGNGDLMAATSFGVFRWDGAALSWIMVGSSPENVRQISSQGGLLYALGDRMRVYNGTVWQVLAQPVGTATALEAGQEVWLGGSSGAAASGEIVVHNAYLGRLNGSNTFDVVEVTGSQVLNAEGVAFSGDTPYMGEHTWQSIISSRRQGVWHHDRWQQANGGNTDTRLGLGVLLSLSAGPDSVVWAGLYAGTGLARLDPHSDRIDLLDPASSGLQGPGIVNLLVHPDGPVLTLHDWSDTEKVEILVDPVNWSDPASWMILPRVGGLGDGPGVWDAVVQRRDVIWFAVETVGLVRWDINGELAGPDDPLTWHDQSDDRWDTLADLPGSVSDLGAVLGLAVGPDGSIWAGGNGLVQFTWDEQFATASLVTNLAEKTSPFLSGLVNGNVRDIALDNNGAVWVATASGLNRVRGSGAEVTIDTYIDLPNYFANPNYGALYSPNVISALPGNNYRKLMANPDGSRLIVSGDQGVSLIDIGPEVVNPAPSLAGAYLYPNPFTGETGGGLKVGGLPGDIRLRVEIYNLEGELVYADPAVTPGQEFWRGGTPRGRAVVTGMYVVRITAGNQSRALTLAVVR